MRELISRWLCRITFHRWGELELGEPYWYKNKLQRPVYVRCRRKNCTSVKSATRRM